MKLLLSVVVLSTAAGTKITSKRQNVVVTRYSGALCDKNLITDIWTIPNAQSPLLQVCTAAGHSSINPDSAGPVASIGDLQLSRLQTDFQTLHLICKDSAYALGTYLTLHDGTPDCNTQYRRERFTLAQSAELAAGRCASTKDDSSSYEFVLNSISLLDCLAGVTGDPHLTNMRGEKFDIHDGLHRLVHYPRGAPKEEALFMVDARAVDMGKDKNCYSVYLDSIKISGKWVGDEISFGSHTNSSIASSNPSAFLMSFASERMDWPTLAKRQDVHLNLKGIMPVTVTSNTRNASGDAANGIMGGEELTLKVGEQHPVLVQVWSSHVHNALTREQEVRYLNVQVKNMPANSGGIIGQDSYSRPSDAQCELVVEEKNLLDALTDATADVSLLSLMQHVRPGWTASASARES